MATNPGGGTGSIGSPAPKPARKPAPAPVGTGLPVALKGAPPPLTRPHPTPGPGEGGPTRGPAPAAPAPAPGLTPDQQSADAYVMSYLKAWGLNDDTLVQQLWNDAKSGQDTNQLMLTLRSSQAYQTHFAGLIKLQAEGSNLDENAYNGVLNSMRDTAHAYGISDAYTSDQFLGNVIGNHVSTAEWQQRLSDLETVVQDNLGGTADYLRSQFGVTTGDMMGFWLNPDQAATDIDQKVRASQIGAAAQYAGVGMIDPTLALHLAGLGVNATQAATGFSKIGQMGELTQSIGGGTSTVSQDQLVGATFDQNAGAQQAIQRAADQRVAAFQEGGAAASTSQGISGLGNANRLNV